jgi:hypothetical protein
VPSLSTPCGRGRGLALCATTGLLVTSNIDNDTLIVFALPPHLPSAVTQSNLHADPDVDRPAPCLTRVAILGSRTSPFPGVRFKFHTRGSVAGDLAFTAPPGPPERAMTIGNDRAATTSLLLVTDVGYDGDHAAAVHVLDVVNRCHVGYVMAPGTVRGPRGVAARGHLAAVSAWASLGSDDHVVHVLRGSGSGAHWAPGTRACGWPWAPACTPGPSVLPRWS